MTRGAVVGIAGAVALAWFAVFAGEYSTYDWIVLRRQVAEERVALDDLRITNDSLARLEHALATDPAAEERAAREQFGMIRPGELLYRIVPAPPAAGDSR